MAAATNAANVKKALANSEPSTHGTSRTPKMSDLDQQSGAKQRLPAQASLPTGC
jgi:hypothetical protein